VLGRCLGRVPGGGGPYYRAYHKAVDTNEPVSFEEHYAPLDLWTEIRAYPSEEGLTIYFRDISGRKAQEAEIHRMAFYDKLTGLPNRQLLLDRLSTRWRWASALAVLAPPVHRSGSLQEHQRHAGMTRATSCCSRWRTALTPCAAATLWRALVATNLSCCWKTWALMPEAQAREIASKLLQAFQAPFEVAGTEHYSTPSIGVALFGRETAGIEEVLKRADLAMYQAKAAGRSAISFFDPVMQSRVSARAALEADMRRALANQEFELHYQPLAGIDGKLAGVEALVRWRHPQRGMVPPAEFIPVAEDTNMILPLGRWVLMEACRRAHAGRTTSARRSWRCRSTSAPSSFTGRTFVEQVLAALSQTGARPDRLRLELTESLLLKDVEGTVEKMQRLRAAGVRFAVDDFGTGYSSLSYLHRLPISQLKIDRSFIWDASRGGHGAAIVRMIVALGKTLEMSVLAEGVETAEQLAFVTEEGCHYYQGYLFSKPLPYNELVAFIARY
jgi:predicted signal transduction protein with EAL and GGDEF domain